VAIYARISTDEDTQRFSLAAQVRELGALAEQRGYEVVDEYTDQTSGTKARRPGLDRLRDDMARGLFDAVLVVDQDRLSRLGELEWALLKREFREAGVRLLTPSQEINFTDEDAEFLSDIFAAVARLERAKLLRRMRRGRAESARRGNWPGRPPYGYRVVNGQLVPDEERARVVRFIFAQYAAGVGAGTIARMLDGIPSPEGCAWRTPGVLRLLRNPAYKGEARMVVNGQEIAIRCEPLVDPALWEECRRIADGRSGQHRAYRLATREALLPGILYCAACGRPLHARASHTTKRGRPYVYRYYVHRTAERRGERETCPAKHRADRLEEAVVRALERLAGRPEVVREMLLADGTTEAERASVAAELAAEEAACQTVTAKLKKLLDLYLADGITREEYLDKRDALDRERRYRERRVAELRERLAGLEAERAALEDVGDYLAVLANTLTMLPREELRRLLQLAFPRVEVDLEGRLQALTRLPLDGDGNFVPVHTIGDQTKRGLKYDTHHVRDSRSHRRKANRRNCARWPEL
jgi:DNA invertase Pin-like site-specific DNA recombinase